MTYNEIVDHINRQLDGTNDKDTFIFDQVIDHHKIKGKYEVLVKWETGEETWEPASPMIRHDPVTMAIYALEHDLLDKPQWKRLRRYVTKGKKRFIRNIEVSVNTAKKTAKFKFGVQVPNNFKEAVEIDNGNGNKDWQDVNQVEMDKMDEYKVFVDYGFKKAPHGYKKIMVHVVFDVKYDGRKRARLITGGHLTDPTNDTPYTGIASLKNIRICIFIAKMNGLIICAADVGSAYLEAFTKEKLYIIAGPEFGDLKGHTLLINKALYGLHLSGGRWAEQLANMLFSLGWKQSKVDATIWMFDQGTHYEYICIWVDDLLIMAKDPMAIIKELEKHFTLKGVGEPEYFLRADMKQVKEPENVFTMG